MDAMNVTSQNHAIVISLYDDINEITQLAESLGYTVYKSFIQHRELPDVKSYIGSGKLKEIIDFLDEHKDISLIIINGELRPSQWFLLEKEFGNEVYDRIKLILKIFKERAQGKEAKLQVRLAELEYERPYVKELIHRTRSGEHPGLMAGGEYQVDDYFEMMKKQMKHIKNKLKKVEKDRMIQRKHRHKTGFYLISLAGYTNAGKSSLLNCLTKNEISVKNQLFSTLSTTTRKINSEKLPILLTDTVGFIENLPPWIIKAFHSTLEEIMRADLVILVADASDPYEILVKKIQTSIDELHHLEVSSPVILALNKNDLLSKIDSQMVNQRLGQFPSISNMQTVFVSVYKKTGIELLLKKILQSLPNLVTLDLNIPQTDESLSFLSMLYEKTYVLSINYGSSIHVLLKCNDSVRHHIESFCKKNKECRMNMVQPNDLIGDIWS